jgi:hypothetical protein
VWRSDDAGNVVGRGLALARSAASSSCRAAMGQPRRPSI